MYLKPGKTAPPFIHTGQKKTYGEVTSSAYVDRSADMKVNATAAHGSACN